MNRSARRTVIVSLFIAMALFAVISLIVTESNQRFLKTLQSEFGGGLNRVLVVYDYSGNEIRRHEGLFDLQSGEPGKVVFDLNGKRTVIHGGIVVVDEQ